MSRVSPSPEILSGNDALDSARRMESDVKPPSNVFDEDEREASTPLFADTVVDDDCWMRELSPAELDAALRHSFDQDLDDDDIEEVYSDFVTEPAARPQHAPDPADDISSSDSSATADSSSVLEEVPSSDGPFAGWPVYLLWVAFLLAVFQEAHSQVQWIPVDSLEANGSLLTSPRLAFLPAAWVVVTSAIMISVWWVGVCLAWHHDRWERHRILSPIDFFWPRRPRKPPDKRPFYKRWFGSPPPPPATRPVGKHKQEQRNQRVFAELLEQHAALRSPTWFDRIFRPKRRQRLLCLALQAAALIASDQPNIDLVETRAHRRRFRSKTKHGLMVTTKLTDEDRVRLRQVIEDLPSGCLTHNDSFDLIFDTGCAKICTGFKADFLPGSLQDLSSPARMDGIAGGLDILQEGMVRCEVLDNNGDVQVITASACFVPDLPCRLFSPQAYMDELHSSGLDPEEKACIQANRNRFAFRWPNGVETSVQCCRTTFLPKIRACTNALDSANMLALKGCVTAETNQNLTSASKHLLRWHFRLGHVGFKLVKWLGRIGALGEQGKKMAAAPKLDIPKCAACLHGKQHKTPTPTKHASNDAPGNLLKEKLAPGDLVFTDQCESRVRGRAFTTRGLSSSLNFGGGTLFCDAASGYIFASHQTGLTASETIESKMRFEREALQAGVTINACHSDNGIFASKEFMRELGEKGQGLTLSGVSAQFQNGAAENGIKLVVRNARTMMLHVALRWPGCAEKDLWPMALSHAIHLWNHTPKMESGISPVEIFTRTKSDCQALRNSHPWGCPVYVLAPKLKDGQKIPKWDPRSKRGQYMGASPMHASTVGLVRNLQTGSMTPQFHMVCDDFFETAHSTDSDEPTEWPDLLVTSRFRSDFDSEDFVPESPDEWLNTQELADRTLERQREREQLLRHQTPDAPPAPSAPTSPPHSSVPPVAPPSADDSIASPSLEDPPAVPPPPPVQLPAPDIPPEPDSSASSSPLRRSTRVRKTPEFFHQDKRCHTAISCFCQSVAKNLVQCALGCEHDFRYIMALLTDIDFGALDTVHPGINQCPHALTGKSKKNDPDAPTWNEAMTGPHRDDFLAEMEQEIKNLEAIDTWQVIPKSQLRRDARILPSTWAFKIKRYPDGRFRKIKSRFCVRGDRQIAGLDCDEKYSPVVSWSAVRMMLSLAASQGLATKQVDFSNAFAQAPFDKGEEIYIAAPRGFESASSDEEVVLKLNRSLCGLVQAPLCWHDLLSAALESHGLKQSAHDPCMFMGKDIIVLTCVDDCLFFAKDSAAIDHLIADLQAGSSAHKALNLTVEDDICAFLGVEFKSHPNGELELTQCGLIDKILKACKMENCNTKATPANQEPLGTNASGPPASGKFEYASVVGMLMCLCSNTRPDVQFAVHQCARFSHSPKKTHEDAVLRICRYLQGTKTKGMRFTPNKSLRLDCHVDADFAGLCNVEHVQDPICVKSRTGFVLTLGNCPLLWISKLQTEVALSAAEAEYIALAQSMRELLPMRSLLKEASSALHLDSEGQDALVHSTIFEDNNGALALASSPRIAPRTKHIAVKHHFFRSHVDPKNGLSISKIDTDLQKADVFTKGLSAEKFQALRKLLIGW